MSAAKQVLEEEYGRSIERQRYLHAAKRELEDGFVAEAVTDLIRVVELLSASEELVMRLHAECFAMVEHAGKILALDASLRPTIIKLDTFPAVGPACERGGEIVDYMIGLCSCGQCPTPRPDWAAQAPRKADEG